jgi:hypothetical protein
VALSPTGFYGFRVDGNRQYPVWMTGGTAATRPTRTQAKPEFENLPPMAAAPAPVNALAPQRVDMGQGFAQPEGGGGGYGAPAQGNTSFGDFMSALGFSGFGSANNTTSGTAPLGAVTSEPLADLSPGLDGGSDGQGAGMGGMDAAGMGGGGMEAGGGYGGMDGAGGMYRGGIVTENRLRGPDPRGPDDGYVAMDRGEGVLTAEAVRHYGPGIVARLNKLAVPKKAFAQR